MIYPFSLSSDFFVLGNEIGKFVTDARMQLTNKGKAKCTSSKNNI
jgi:hypothetical protein